ncbi:MULTISPECIES: DUF1283 family protein [Photorhabdus]|uniref:UPF0482 protein VY86_19930 n=2 Tax=Photorhabdus TaxID=29487 RepID=A0A0F7LU09_9GAMM|nr:MULTISPECIES: DUF1283 family protein [Photorhabdus]AKH65282.1 hypothetical protein VY86_19930 [Photorhabdus thracensis]MCC8422892.1 DUF1283 family protein [Photorhabdus thracensis]NHB89637.1 hypothetical protein [Photorhabdus tasmaniensis]
MNFCNSLILKAMPAIALAIPLLWQAPALAATCSSGGTCVTVNGNGDTALSKEAARQSKEQWDETKNLRTKVNKRAEKEFDKFDKAIDARDACMKSTNINAYWEPNTERCLDSNTGMPIRP